MQNVSTNIDNDILIGIRLFAFVANRDNQTSCYLLSISTCSDPFFPNGGTNNRCQQWVPTEAGRRSRKLWPFVCIV